MKGLTRTLWALGVLMLVSCAPAYAQAYVGSSASSYGSAINSGQNGMAKASFPTHYSLPDASTQVLTYSGSNSEFVPSLFMSYDKALAKGVADLAAKPKTLAEVAQEYRKEQRAKAQTSFVQDANGKPVKAEKE
jgi:hypothetical protein